MSWPWIARTVFAAVVMAAVMAGALMYKRAKPHTSAVATPPPTSAPATPRASPPVDFKSFCSVRSLTAPDGPITRTVAGKQQGPRSAEEAKRALREAGWLPSLLEVSSSCPRVLAGSTEPGGLGHRFSALVHLLLFANDTDSTVVVPMRFLSESVGHEARPDAYGWAMPIMFGVVAETVLRETPPSMPGPTGFAHDKDFLAAVRDRPCNRSSLAMVGFRNFCSNTYCVMVRPDSYRRARSFFRIVAPPEPPKAGPLVAAWHVRVGDQVLGSATAFLTLACQLPRGLAHVVFSTAPLCSGPHAALFCDFARLLSNARFENRARTSEVVQAMRAADFLVSTGSSFASVAAELAHDRQVVLAFGAKEGPVASQCYDRGDALAVSPDGVIENRTAYLAKLATLLRE